MLQARFSNTPDPTIPFIGWAISAFCFVWRLRRPTNQCTRDVDLAADGIPSELPPSRPLDSTKLARVVGWHDDIGKYDTMSKLPA